MSATAVMATPNIQGGGSSLVAPAIGAISNAATEIGLFGTVEGRQYCRGCHLRRLADVHQFVPKRGTVELHCCLPRRGRAKFTFLARIRRHSCDRIPAKNYALEKSGT
ncbi:hypothetical protein F3J12_23625 [Burkholderia sp. Ax-1735]|nr:hypothetical protein [Burkholderia sp. Ap-955]NIF12451.1 hypothetical protein [Burkholderia sp. Ax-1735]NIG01465.1 hypothetical protein [Burkholderia sp. Tr-849]